MNWNQAGMPTALVSHLGQKREIAEFKSALNDAQNHIMRPVDAELMAQELARSGGREFVELVKGLTTALKNAQKELEDANRRYDRLTADLMRRGIRISEVLPTIQKPNPLPEKTAANIPPPGPKSPEDGLAEWEEWNRRFQSLLS